MSKKKDLPGSHIPLSRPKRVEFKGKCLEQTPRPGQDQPVMKRHHPHERNTEEDGGGIAHEVWNATHR